MFAEEVAVVMAISSMMGRRRINDGLREVNLYQVPAGAKGSSRTIGNEEEAVGRLSNCIKEGSTGGVNDRWRKGI